MRKKDRFIPKMYQRMLLPSLLSSVGYALADVADAFVLGQKVGETGLAAISICLPVFMLINVFMDSFGTGGSVRFSQLLGEGEKAEAADCFNRTWLAVLCCGIGLGIAVNVFAPQVLTLLGAGSGDGALHTACENYLRIIALGSPALMLNIVFYNFLRNDDNASLASLGFLVGNATDIILNFILVLGVGLGTRGAAMATVTGSVVAICLYLPGIVTSKANILHFQKVKPDFKELRECFQTGFSTSVQHVFQFAFLLLVNRLLMSLSGQNGVAVFDLVYNVSYFITYPITGAAEAAQPLVSTFSGENNEEDCKSVLRLLTGYGLGILTVVTGAIFVFAAGVARVFGISEEILPLAVYAIRVYCGGYLFIGLNIIYETYYQAKENFSLAFFLSLMKRFAILLPCALLFSLFGLRTIWLMFPAAELLSFLTFLLYRRHTNRSAEEFDPARVLRFTFQNNRQDLSQLFSDSQSFCEQWSSNPQQQYYVNLVIEELCTSIIRNALKNDPNGEIRFTLLAMPEGDFKLHMLDNAVKYDPFSIRGEIINKEDDLDFDFDAISISLVKKNAKKFMYRQCCGFNSLVVQI